MDTNDVHPFTVASIEASGGFEWTTNPVATARCGCSYRKTTFRYRLCTYHEGFDDGAKRLPSHEYALEERDEEPVSTESPLLPDHADADAVLSHIWEQAGVGSNETDVADDIVERLRAVDGHGLIEDHLAPIEAADEIERLRVAGDALEVALSNQPYTGILVRDVLASLAAWQEARRG